MKIEILDNESANRHDYSPIEHIKSRLKPTENIVMKLKRDGYKVTIGNIMECFSDIAGIRITCSFTSDIYQIADTITAQGGVTVLHVKNYTKNPKSSGYKSHHMIIIVPVYPTGGPMGTKVEIQIRSATVDFQVSLGHKIVYKLEGNAPENLLKELKACAGVMDMLDIKIFSFNEAITVFAGEQKEGSEES